MATKKTTTSSKAEKAAPKKSTVAKKAAAPKASAAKKATVAKEDKEDNKVAKKAPTATKKTATKKAAAAPKADVATKKEATAKKSSTKVAKTTPTKAAPKKASTVAETPKVQVKTEKTTTEPLSKTKETEAKNTKSVANSSVKRTSGSSTKSSAKKDDKVMPIITHRKKEKSADKEPVGVLNKFTPATKSVLDPPEQPAGPMYRYSDEELNEFKEIILKRLEAARDNLAYYQNLISRKDEAGDESDNRLNSMEDGSGAMEKEQLSMMAARQVQFINNLEKALIRIENKTYGICRETGVLIDKARLRAVPHATLSIEAKKSMKK